MSFRIISGKNKGRRITAPGSLPVRPTMDFAKEGLFNVMGNYFDMDEVSALDLYSGTGNISYELASRGARKVVSVDSNSACAGFIKLTADKLAMPEISVIKSDVLKFLDKHFSKYDIIFADPPFDMEGKEAIHKAIIANDLLKPDGWFILEHPASEDYSKLELFWDRRSYGKVNFSIFTKSVGE